MNLFKDTNYQFIEKSKGFVVFSGILIAITLFSIFFHNGLNYGIDFNGGSLVQLKFTETPDLSLIRKQLTADGMGNVEVKTFGELKDNEIQLGLEKEDGFSVVDKVRKLMNENYKGKYEIRREEVVGPKIGSELKTKMGGALFLSLLAIILYIWFRFRLVFGFAAIAALFHDVIITLGVFSLLDLEISISIIAAFLTIVGYSLNDTIVVFDRIRENDKLLSRSKDFKSIVNISINQSLSRTVITSLTTFAAVLVLYVFGVAVIKDFALALMVGVAIGTYSSIGVASALLVNWKKK